MPVYSESSRKKLVTCREELQIVFLEVIVITDVRVIWGIRDIHQQNKCFDEGTSKKLWPDSKHNAAVGEPEKSKAIDVAPYPIDWQDVRRFYFVAGVAVGVSKRLGIPIRWGGDWDGDGDLTDQRFNDLGHFELI